MQKVHDQKRINPNTPEVATISDKKTHPTPAEGAHSNIVNFAEKHIQTSISHEIQEKQRKIQKAYEKSGIDTMEVLKNSELSPEDRIKKAEEILARKISPEEKKSIDHIHNNISK